MRPMGDGVLSLSSDRWRYHSAGGVPKVTFLDSQVSQQPTCCKLNATATVCLLSLLLYAALAAHRKLHTIGEKHTALLLCGEGS